MQEISPQTLAFMAEKFRMLGDPTRLAILRYLMAEGERNVGQIVAQTGSTQANISKHLKLLASAGMVARRKVGLHVWYRLDDPAVEKICHLVCETIVADMAKQAGQARKMLRGSKR